MLGLGLDFSNISIWFNEQEKNLGCLGFLICFTCLVLWKWEEGGEDFFLGIDFEVGKKKKKKRRKIWYVGLINPQKLPYRAQRANSPIQLSLLSPFPPSSLPKKSSFISIPIIARQKKKTLSKKINIIISLRENHRQFIIIIFNYCWSDYFKIEKSSLLVE